MNHEFTGMLPVNYNAIVILSYIIATTETKIKDGRARPQTFQGRIGRCLGFE